MKNFFCADCGHVRFRSKVCYPFGMNGGGRLLRSECMNCGGRVLKRFDASKFMAKICESCKRVIIVKRAAKFRKRIVGI